MPDSLNEGALSMSHDTASAQEEITHLPIGKAMLEMPAIFEELRAQTPGCQGVLHLNSAGMSLPTQSMVDRVIAHLNREAQVGGYRAAWEVGDELEEVYVAAADLLGAKAHEIALVDSATRAWNLILGAFRFVPGDRIIVGRNEYGSNMIALLQRAKYDGVTIEICPETQSGHIDLNALSQRLDERVKLVALTHIATNSGLIQPAKAVGDLLAPRGIPYLLDACQSTGQVPIDVREIGCTMLAATGRKYLRGPRGTGLLWVHEDWIKRLEPREMDAQGATWSHLKAYTVREDARRFELWERNFATLLGLGVALKELNTLGIGAVSQRIAQLAAYLRAGLSALPRVQVHDRGDKLGGLVTFTVDGYDNAALRAQLREEGINISVSGADMTRIDMEARGLPSLLRASVHAYNTVEELQRFITRIGQCA